MFSIFRPILVLLMSLFCRSVFVRGQEVLGPLSCLSSCLMSQQNVALIQVRNAGFMPKLPRGLFKQFRPSKPTEFMRYNEVVYPPLVDGPRRPAEICHQRANIKGSPDKAWYLAAMVRGMSIDEAIKQLSFHKKKMATDFVETLKEAQEKAVRDFNVEFRSNLWVESSYVGRAPGMKSVRRGGRGRVSILEYRYFHYFVRLREGLPPARYYPTLPDGFDAAARFIAEERARSIDKGL